MYLSAASILIYGDVGDGHEKDRGAGETYGDLREEGEEGTGHWEGGRPLGEVGRGREGE